MKADCPKEVLRRNSILTRSLAISILNAKYVNDLPVYRISQKFLRNDIRISRQMMANWVIQCVDRYDYFHNRIYRFHVLQTDETLIKVLKDGDLWKLIDSIDGAKSSAIVYSFAETAKANKLNPFRYLE